MLAFSAQLIMKPLQLVMFVILMLWMHTSLLAQSNEKPLEYYEKLVEDQQKALDLHNEAFKLYRDQEYEKALVLFNQAIALDTTNSHYFSNRGHTHKYLGNWEAALADYRSANAIHPELTHDTYFQSGEIYQKELKNYSAAIQMYTKSIEILKASGPLFLIYLSYFNRANCYLRTKAFQQAISDYSSSIQIKADHYGSYTNRGLARYHTGDKKGACADWQKAFELGHQIASTYVNNYCK